MVKATQVDPAKQGSIRALEATNFFLADAQTDNIRKLISKKRRRRFHAAACMSTAGLGLNRLTVELTIGAWRTIFIDHP